MRNPAFFAVVAFVVVTSFDAFAADGCTDAYPVPAEPSPTSEAVTFRAARAGQGFWATVWRNQCPSGVPRLWIRVVPDRDAFPFICGQAFSVIAGGAAKAVSLALVPGPGNNTYCGNLSVPTTFFIDQVAGQTYDTRQALTVVYDGVDTQYRATLAAYGAGPPPALAIENGVWWDPTQSGTGYGVSVRNGVLVMQIYSYRDDGEPQWYLTAGPLLNGNRTYTGTLDKYVGGQCLGCRYTGRPTADGNDGTVTIQFNTGTSATITWPEGGTAAIVPLQF